LAKISIVSCINDFEKYNACVGASFREAKKSGVVELLRIDNTSNNLSIAAALNRGRQVANGDIIVFCHQDVMFPPNWHIRLLEQIDMIEKHHPNWGVIGTFGVAKNGMLAGHIIDFKGHFYCLPLPAEVQSLDEHCLIIRNDSELFFDEEVCQFHLYGADICIQATAKGLINFAIDNCVQHLSSGKINPGFEQHAELLYQKWKKRNPPVAVIETTCKVIRLRSGLQGIISYAIASHRRKKRLKKARRLRKTVGEFGAPRLNNNNMPSGGANSSFEFWNLDNNSV
jgi:glycosyltransferase involved in cell wall biosynthesis